jgi:hypothetical protein
MFAHFYFRFSPREELIDYHLQFLRRLRQRQRQESIVLTIDIFDSSSPVCCAFNYVRSATNFAAANWRPCIHVRKRSRRIVYLPLSPASAQWILCARRKEYLNAITNYSTQSPIIGYSSLRSSRRPGIGRRNLSLTLQQVLCFVKVSFSVYFT